MARNLKQIITQPCTPSYLQDQFIESAQIKLRLEEVDIFDSTLPAELDASTLPPEVLELPQVAKMVQTAQHTHDVFMRGYVTSLDNIHINSEGDYIGPNYVRLSDLLNQAQIGIYGHDIFTQGFIGLIVPQCQNFNKIAPTRQAVIQAYVRNRDYIDNCLYYITPKPYKKLKHLCFYHRTAFRL